MTFAFALHPRPSKKKIQSTKLIFKELDNLVIYPLLNFITNNDISNLESQYIMQQLLSKKWNYHWIYSIPEVYNFFVNNIYDDSSLNSLKKLCQFTKKLPSISISTPPFYVKNNQALWNRFLEDLSQLNIDQNDHLFHNLKYFLEWEQYNINEKNKVLIAQILSPFYTSLKLNPNIPVPFLAETLKLLLFLDPKNPKGNQEFFQLLESSCNLSEQIDFLKQTIFLPSQNKQLFLSFIDLLTDAKDIENYTEKIILHKNLKLNFHFYQELSELLLNKGFIELAFFSCLQAFILSKKKNSSYQNLQKFFFYFELQSQFNFCKKKIDNNLMNFHFIKIEASIKKLQYRLHHNLDWLNLKSSFLYLSSESQVQVQFRLKEDSDEVSIFYPDKQTLMLNFINKKLLLQAWEIPKNKSLHHLSFDNKDFILDEQFLESFKGFHKN